MQICRWMLLRLTKDKLFIIILCHFAVVMIMMMWRWCFVVLAGLINVALVYGDAQSKECTFTESKRHSCLYFVIRNDKDHPASASYCWKTFNGALPGIYQSYEEAKDVMKRYFWWAQSDMNVERIHFGVLYTGGNIYTQTWINPVENDGVAVDMDLWTRSFPNRTNITLREDLYDVAFPRRDFGSHFNQYMAVTPKNFKWSNSNWGKMIPFICEVPRFPKAFCEPGWILHMKSRSCLYLNKIVSNFPTAAMKCRELGSNVASINDETENELALKMINKAGSNEQVWIGLRWDAARSNIADIPGKNPYETFYKYFVENMAYNVDGTPVSPTYHHFRTTNQPNGFRELDNGGTTSENCILYEKDDRLWDDYDCLVTQAWSLCRKMAETQRYP